MVLRGVRYRIKTVSPKARVRLAFRGKKKVVEITPYEKKRGRWVKGRSRSDGERKAMFARMRKRR